MASFLWRDQTKATSPLAEGRRDRTGPPIYSNIQMGGGCQGCGQVDVTLKYGIETAIRVEGVGDILDVTDHSAGRNPYYVASEQ